MDKKYWSNVLKAFPGAMAPPTQARRAPGSWSPRTYPAAAGQVTPQTSAPDPTIAALAGLEVERKALAAERTDLEQTSLLLQTCLAEIAARRAAWCRQDGEDLVGLIVKIAAVVIHDEVTQRPDVIASQVKAALMRVKEDGLLTLRVHPRTVESLRAAMPSLLTSERRLHIEPDASIEPGGCLVETPQRIVDARLDVQLALVAGALRRELSEAL